MTATRDTAATALARFDHAWATLDKTVQGLSERELTEIRDPAGWSAKDHLMHVATWEQALLAKLDGRARHQALGLDASTDGSEDWDGLNAEIFAAKLNQLVTSTIGKIDSTTYSSVTAKPDAAAMRNQSDGFGSTPRSPINGIANITRYVNP